jgi:hypothetical protein
MGANIFYYHGNLEVLLNGNWVKVTPVYDSEICKIEDISPL